MTSYPFIYANYYFGRSVYINSRIRKRAIKECFIQLSTYTVLVDYLHRENALKSMIVN
jgi:hypothetical protein